MAATNPPSKPTRAVALAEALVVMAVWGSSFVLIKAGLDHAGPLTLAGLRYFTAFLILLPFLIRRNRKPLARAQWVRLVLLGLLAYTFGNGALFWGMKYLSATTSSFLMSLNPVIILILGIFLLRENPTWLQVAGMVISVGGCGVFFAPGLQGGQSVGLAIFAFGLLAFAAFGVLGRGVAREQSVGTLALTAYPLAFGGATLLVVAAAVEGLPRITPTGAGIVLWLALINTAIAYLLYNHSLQTLTALEMNLVLNLSPFATALIAAFALSEVLTPIQYVGMIVATLGVGLAQWQRKARVTVTDGTAAIPDL